VDLKEKIKKVRGNLTFKEFSKKTGISDAALVRYEQGRTPKIEQLQKIADSCGISIDYFFDTQKSERHEIKIVGMVPAGHTSIYDQPEVLDPLVLPFKQFKNCIAVQVTGASMENLFYDGDILIIRECQDQSPRKDGLTYVIEWEEADQLTRAVKYVYRESNGFRLVSENKIFKDIYTDNITKLYRIVGVIYPNFRYQTTS